MRLTFLSFAVRMSRLPCRGTPLKRSPLAPLAPLAALARVLVISLAVTSATTYAFAAKNDDAALKLRKAAIETDYLSGEYGAAESKLGEALGMCGGADCTTKTRARIRCDLGAVLFAHGKAKDARAAFQQALADDPGVTLDKDLSSPPLEAAFVDAKTGDEKAPLPVTISDGTMVHTPPAEQAILTPIPIYVELAEDVKPTKVYVRYKAFGQTAWKTAELHALGSGFGGEIPCLDVGSMNGDLDYFVQATDASGDVVAAAGSAKKPLHVAVRAKLEGKPPHLPGQPPPVACADPADCPPGFPGCRKVDGGSGAACESSSECGSGFTCSERRCERVAGEKPGELEEHWLSLAFQQDFVLVPSAVDACNGGNGYACFDGDQYYERIPLANADNEVGGGLGVATRRLLLGYDYALNANLLLGARLGVAFSGGPARPGGKSFLPLHAEARAAYFFGAAPLATTDVKFFVAVGLGLAEYDVKVAVSAYADRPAYQRGDGKTYDAWKKSGDVFGSLGLGTMIPFGLGHGVIAELKALQMLGTSATGFGAQVGYAFGL